MTFKEIQELIRLVTKSNLTEFKLKDGEFEVTIRTEEYAKSKGQTTQVISAPSPVVAMPSAPAPAPVSPTPSAPAPAVTPTEKSAEKPAPAAESDGNYIQIKSPMVGTFYRSSSPEKPPYLQVGDSVQKGSVVCIIEAMKLFNEIESEVSGKVVKVLADDASPVEYDQPLFLIDPNG